MNWNEKCMMELTHRNLFENSDHRMRFRDLLNCYYQSLFFTKGLCKCMYLASWDDEHFVAMLDILNQMTLEGDKNLHSMKDQGEVREQQLEGQEAEIYKLSNAFLNEKSYELPEFDLMDPEGAYIIRRALLAAEYIEELPEV